MEYRPLGRTGVQVSQLCLGCMMFGRVTSAEDAYPIIDRALDAGINFLDTANVYARGMSEQITGEALQRNGKRKHVVLATKVHGRMADDDPEMTLVRLAKEEEGVGISAGAQTASLTRHARRLSPSHHQG